MAWAPVVLASFGSGTGVITVRVVAPHGAAAYQASLGADLAESIPSAHMDAAAYTRAALAVLSTAAARIRPARVISGTVRGQPALQIQFTAPSPLETTGSGAPADIMN